MLTARAGRMLTWATLMPLVLDRNGCWDYETYQTNRCNGLYDAAEEAIWDMQNGNYAPLGLDFGQMLPDCRSWPAW
jgi:hypothetical protein